MPDLDELFDEATVVGDGTEEVDYLVIDHNFRTIEIPSSKSVLLGVTSDEKVNTLHFKCQRYYEDVDLGDFSFRINYLNAVEDGDMYLVADKVVRENEIEFSWTVGRHAFEAAGNVVFVVCAKLFNENAEVIKEYNTVRHAIPVEEGLETDESIVERYPDIIEHILESITLEVSGGTASISAAGWTGNDPYAHALELANVTANSKVDIQADAATIAVLNEAGVTSLWVQNDNAVLTLYAAGASPSEDMTLQFTITEVNGV